MVANIAWTMRDRLADIIHFAGDHLRIAWEEVEPQSKSISSTRLATVAARLAVQGRCPSSNKARMPVQRKGFLAGPDPDVGGE